MTSPASAAIHPRDTMTTTLTGLNPSTFGFDQQQNVTLNFTVTSDNPDTNAGGVGSVDVWLANPQDGNGESIVCTDPALGNFGEGSCTIPAGKLPVGSHHLFAFYNGDPDLGFQTSESGLIPITITQVPTTVRMTHPDSTVAYGQESAETFSLQLTPRAGTATGTAGVADFTENGLCTGTLTNNATTCKMTNTQHTPGNYTIFGFYASDGTYSGANTASETLTVTKGTTNTRVRLSNSTIAVNQEGNEKVSVQVTPPLDGTPTGQVTFEADGAPFGNPMTIAADGTADAFLPAGELPVGIHSITVFYNGDSNFEGSTSAPAIFTVTKASTTTAVTLSSAKVTFGHEQVTATGQPEKLTIKVTGSGGAPSGTVTIKDNGTAIATRALTGGTVTLPLTATQFKPGTHKLTASYGGDSNFASSASTTTALNTLVVATEPTTAALALAHTTIKAGHEQTEKLTVTVKPKFTGPAPAGQVTIKAGSMTLCTITTLKNGTGSCTLSASRLKPGTYTLVTTYTGTSPYASSIAPKRTLLVIK
jgi:hypothetical protein